MQLHITRSQVTDPNAPPVFSVAYQIVLDERDRELYQRYGPAQLADMTARGQQSFKVLDDAIAYINRIQAACKATLRYWRQASEFDGPLTIDLEEDGP